MKNMLSSEFFQSKNNKDMFESLPREEEEKEARGVQRMDPSGPFVGDVTRGERVPSNVSNVEMEDVSRNTRIANAPALPRHPIFNGTTTRDKRDFIEKYNLYYQTLLSYETEWNKPFVMPVSACIEPWLKEHIARFKIGKSVAEISET